MVSSARNAWSSIVVIDGMSSTVDASTPRPTSAPSMRSHTGVNRLEYSGNRIVRDGVQQALGRPRLPADAAAHRMPPLVAARSRAAARRRRRARRTRRRRRASPGTSHASARSAASPRCVEPAMPDGDHGAARGERGDRQQREEERRERRRRRASGVAAGRLRRRRARPGRSARRASRPSAGPTGTRPKTAEPGAISAPLPIRAPGSSVLRAPIVELGADAHPADAHDVAVDPVAGEVDLGLDRGAVADREHAGDRRQRVQVDVARRSSRRARGRSSSPTARRRGPTASTWWAIWSASHMRRCTAPPRG